MVLMKKTVINAKKIDECDSRVGLRIDNRVLATRNFSRTL